MSLPDMNENIGIVESVSWLQASVGYSYFVGHEHLAAEFFVLQGSVVDGFKCGLPKLQQLRWLVSCASPVGQLILTDSSILAQCCISCQAGLHRSRSLCSILSW